MPAPPPRPEQYMTALEEANRVRIARAKRKREVKADRSMQLAIQTVRNPPEYMWAMTTGDFLASLHRIGDAYAERILESAGASLTCTLGALTERQRGAVAKELSKWQTRRRVGHPRNWPTPA